MQINIEKTCLDDVILIVPELYIDNRGSFSEFYRSDQFKNLNLPQNFNQFNYSFSQKNVLRGLHFQWNPPMGKMMRVSKGSAFLVAVDIRVNSPNLGKYYSIILSENDKKFLYAPDGFARGFCVTSDYAEIEYFCTNVYNKNCESGILWNDKEINIQWPIPNPILTEKDKNAFKLSDWLKKEEALFFKK